MQHSEHEMQIDKNQVALLDIVKKVCKRLNERMVTQWVVHKGEPNNLPHLQCAVDHMWEANDVRDEIQQLFSDFDLDVDYDRVFGILAIPNYIIAEMIKVESKIQWPSDGDLGFSGDGRNHQIIENIMNSPELNYKVTDQGLCCAYAFIARNAFMARDVNALAERLESFYQWPATYVLSVDSSFLGDNLANHSNEIDFDSGVGLVRFNDTLNFVIKDMENNNYIISEISLSKSSLMDFDELMQPGDTLKQLNEFQIPFLSALNIDRDKNDESEEDDESEDDKLNISMFIPLMIKSKMFMGVPQLVDMLAFFDAIKIYQESEQFYHLSENGYMTMDEVTEIVNPNKLEKTPIFKVDNFCGAYTTEDMQSYIRSIQYEINQSQLKMPIGFILENICHAIFIGYDPLSKKWTLIQMSNNKILYFSPSEIDVKKMAATIMRGFFQSHEIGGVENAVVIMETRIDGHKSEEQAIKKFLSQWKNSHIFISLHEITKDRIRLFDNYNVNWLLMATKNNHSDLAISIMKNGAGIDKRDTYYGNTLLHYAAYNTEPDMALELLKNPQLDVDVLNNNGETPLILAVKANNYQMVCELLKLGANFFIKNNQDKTSLDLAREAGYLEIRNEIEKRSNDYRCFVKAIKNKKIPEIDFYLKHNFIHVCLLSSIRDEDEYTLLHVVIEDGYLECAKLFLDYGVKADLLNKKGQTPLHLAVIERNIDAVKLLLDSKADPFKKDKEGFSPFYFSIYCNPSSENCMDEILKSKYISPAEIFKGVCDSIDHPIVFKRLLKIGFDFHIKDRSGSTMLHHHMVDSDLIVIKSLINDAHIDIDVADDDGQTALDYAFLLGEHHNAAFILQTKILNFQGAYSGFLQKNEEIRDKLCNLLKTINGFLDLPLCQVKGDGVISVFSQFNEIQNQVLEKEKNIQNEIKFSQFPTVKTLLHPSPEVELEKNSSVSEKNSNNLSK